MKITKSQLHSFVQEELKSLGEDDWPKKVKKGRFTDYCKGAGFDGPGIGCAEKAMDSSDASVRGMASFYMNTVKPKGKDASDVAEESQQLTKHTLQEYVKEVLSEVTAGAQKFAQFDDFKNQWSIDMYDEELASNMEDAIDTIITPEMENLGLQDKAASGMKRQGITNYSSPSDKPYKSVTIDMGDQGDYEIEVYPSTDEETMQSTTTETLMDAIKFVRGVLSPQGAVSPAPGESPAQAELPLQENRKRTIKIRRKKK